MEPGVDKQDGVAKKPGAKTGGPQTETGGQGSTAQPAA